MAKKGQRIASSVGIAVSLPYCLSQPRSDAKVWQAVRLNREFRNAADERVRVLLSAHDCQHHWWKSLRMLASLTHDRQQTICYKDTRIKPW
jgi:hypothetical protein